MWSAWACESATTSTLRNSRSHRYGATTSSPVSSCVRVAWPKLAMPPPSTSSFWPLGKTTRMLSPCPTSMAVISNWPGWKSGGNGCQIKSASAAATLNPVIVRHHLPRARAAAISAAANAMPSHTGGVGMRRLGSMCACQDTMACESCNSQPPSRATQPQPVNTATKPTGTATPITGTTSALADSPEIPSRWK